MPLRKQIRRYTKHTRGILIVFFGLRLFLVHGANIEALFYHKGKLTAMRAVELEGGALEANVFHYTAGPHHFFIEIWQRFYIRFYCS
jgi:hypothetical protein